MIEDAADLVEQNADILRARRRLDAQQLFDGADERMLLVHRADIVQAIEIGRRLGIGLVFDQLLGAAMQQADMRIRALDDLAAHLENEAEHAVRGRMLRAEIDIEGFDLGFSHGQAFPAFSSPGRRPSHGLKKSKVRKSWVSLTGS